jgi:SAM-dependent methyltransferase
MEFCTGPDWHRMLEEDILPGALELADLGPRVVEVGPGPGFTTDVLLRSAEHVTAVEIDPTLAEQLRQRLGGASVTVVVGDARHTGLEASSHTGAASFHMLHHVPTDAEQDEVFAELARVVQPGGALLLADGFDSDGIRQFHEGDIYNPIDPATLPTRLSAVGFTGVEVVSHDLGWYCSATAAE